MRYILLIVSSVVFLVWLSTLADNTIREKVEFYSTSAGTFVAMGVFMLPFLIVFQMINDGRLSFSNKPKFFKTIAIMLCVQISFSAFIPQVVSLYQNAGDDVANFVINAKDANNQGGN